MTTNPGDFTINLRKIARFNLLGMVWSWSVEELRHYQPPNMNLDGPAGPFRPERLPMEWTIAEGYAFTERQARRRAHRAIRREQRRRSWPSHRETASGAVLAGDA